MSFAVIYYLTLACPSVERTLEMVGRYIEHGATRFQLDMPSSDPYGETELVKKMMAGALAVHPDYDYYMDALRRLRARYPQIELSLVVYRDVMDAIGIEKLTDFCTEIRAHTVRQAGRDERDAYAQVLHRRGLPTVEAIDYAMSEESVDRARRATCFVTMRTRRAGETPLPGLETWTKRIALARSRGVHAPIFAIADMTAAKHLTAAREGGAAGVVVGNVLMRLWDNEDALWEKFNELQACAE